MASRTALCVICYLFLNINLLYSQDQVIEVIDSAKESYVHESYQEASEQLTKALQLINDKLLTLLKSAFPEPPGGWRADEATGSLSGNLSLNGLTVKQSYFKKGGGPSVYIEMVTNSIKIGNIKMLFASPSKLKRAGGNLKICTVANRKCLERYDAIDRYAELIFVPTSSLLVTIIGQDMKNTKTVKQYAKKINWDELEETFP